MLRYIDQDGSIQEAALVHLLLDSGLRGPEAAALNLRDLDLEARPARVFVGSGGARLVRYLADRAWIVLLDWVGHRVRVSGARERDAVFTNRYGMRLERDAIDAALGRLGIRAKLSRNLSVEVLRNTLPEACI